MQIVFLIGMFILGAVMGSFLACQARRLKWKDCGKKKLSNRSVCLHCKTQLRWYDNIPIISWVILGGRCRKCGKKIGLMEILSEVLMGMAFLGLATTVNINYMAGIDWPLFGSMMVLMLGLGFLAIYDGEWGELPNFVLALSSVIAVIILVLKINRNSFWMDTIWETLGAIGILGGVYLLLYLVSRGKWVGDGDCILGTILAVALGDAWLALVTLFLANFLGCVVMTPVVKNKKEHKIHFGPFLVVAFVITVVFANFFKGLLIG